MLSGGRRNTLPLGGEVMRWRRDDGGCSVQISQRGEGLALIGRVFDRSTGAIFQHLKPHGGIRPVPRRRSRRVLSMDEREEISRGIAVGVSLRSLARQLRRAPSTISRELKRNGGQRVIVRQLQTSARGIMPCDPSCASSPGMMS